MSEAGAATSIHDSIEHSHFDPLRAPRENGEILCLPAPVEWPRIVDANRRLRAAYQFEIGGRKAGAWVREAADDTLILTGHQPEFFHPGVWAKNVAAAAGAGRMGARCGFVIVDNDAPDGTALRWPEEAGGRLHTAEMALDWGPEGTAFEQMPPHSTAEWLAIWERVPSGIRSNTATAIQEFAAAFLKPAAGACDAAASPCPCADYVSRWMSGIAAVDAALDVPSPRMFRVGNLAELHGGRGLSWGGFVTHLVRNARSFATSYNHALHAYRRARHIGGTRHPIPDLIVTDDRVELPLWAYEGTRPRERVRVTDHHGDVIVWAGDAQLGRLSRDSDLSADGRMAGWKLRPRALTLTMYARLFLCDLFIHGLGGAKYDVICDEIIRRFFGAEPPQYACVTATLRLDLGRPPVTPAERFAGLRRLRDVQFNPQRLLTHGGDAAALTARTEAIAESERLRRERNHQHLARRRIFERIRAMNSAIRASEPQMERAANDAWRQLSLRLEDQTVAGSREWFYALCPKAALRNLADRLRVTTPSR